MAYATTKIPAGEKFRPGKNMCGKNMCGKNYVPGLKKPGKLCPRPNQGMGNYYTYPLSRAAPNQKNDDK